MSVPLNLAKFDGKVLVPEGAFEAAPGDVFEVRPQKRTLTTQEWHAFLDGVEGAWVGPDLEEPAELPMDVEDPVF